MSEQRVALVTGSSSGIGAAVARRLADAGYRIVVNSARSVAAGEALAAALPDAVYVRADVSDESQAAALVAAAAEAYGRLDLLVNCAGTTRFIPHDDLEAASPEVWRHLYDVNVIGVWQTVTAAVPHLRKTGGNIVTVSSQAGVRPGGSSIPYAVSKAAVNHMTKLLAKTLGPDIRVNAVAPGLIDTPWFDGVEGADAAKEHVAGVVPLRRVGRPEDIAGAVFDLAHASYITGEILLVDGGGHLLG
ncbi:SDR family NAD(P)-dependent oxidoreductase [Streptomyces sp. SP18ES09]|uniref:SDR family NAD(P)-dependent oxidoreductase n=1 Tax=Streptomyces sp. SP18ES09 TaxID=3002532 RepID=UPI002E77F75A|nr:SDR family oxidoreductase [Streptomyces sp. SP18ES09]MEE1819031.1 SDR family NAD(P)-dependent oxidoreductase [Streptomyces sp. SP18ES09]